MCANRLKPSRDIPLSLQFKPGSQTFSGSRDISKFINRVPSVKHRKATDRADFGCSNGRNPSIHEGKSLSNNFGFWSPGPLSYIVPRPCSNYFPLVWKKLAGKVYQIDPFLIKKIFIVETYVIDDGRHIGTGPDVPRVIIFKLFTITFFFKKFTSPKSRFWVSEPNRILFSCYAHSIVDMKKRCHSYGRVVLVRPETHTRVLLVWPDARTVILPEPHHELEYSYCSRIMKYL